LNPGRRGGEPETNHLSYGAAIRHLFRISKDFSPIYLGKSCPRNVIVVILKYNYRLYCPEM
jgi:hypothetical protein